MKTGMPSRLLLIVLAGSGLLLASCGPTNEELITEFKPQFETLRADLQAVAAMLPATAPDQPAQQPFQPAPSYLVDPLGSGITNSDILMYENLNDPDLNLRNNDRLDLALSNFLLRYLRWTGPDNPMADDTRGQRVGKDAADEFEQALQIRYLAVARVVTLEKPVVLSAESFQSGFAEIDGYLVDLRSRTIVCSFTVQAESSEEVHYAYEEDSDPEAALARFASSTLWENSRQVFLARLNEYCGGGFTSE